MIILSSLLSLILLLMFFSFLGFGVTSTHTAKNNLALVPVFGYAAFIGLSYVISANFKISGAESANYTVLLLACLFLIRIRHFFSSAKVVAQNGELAMFFLVIAIPCFTILLPAIILGFKYFYAFVNYDFFYNSQDSWLLQTHNVIQYNINNFSIVPLDWSANYSGRIAVGLLGAFFPQWIQWDALQFNSLLLNTIVILFSLTMSVFCRDFFGVSRKIVLLAVFFSVMSAGYVQAYCYYVLGQVSTIPIFILFCIYLKQFLDTLIQQASPKDKINNMIVMGLLLNILFVMYAILSFFALCLMALSYLLVMGRQFKLRSLLSIMTVASIAILLFCLLRLLIVPETISIFKSWISLSSRVAEGSAQASNIFIVCSEYLTEVVFALLFGIVNYPSTGSIFALLTRIDLMRTILLIIFGLGALLTTVFVMRFYYLSKKSKSARAVVLGLLSITMVLSVYFFFTWSGYGLYKLQTWFMPILIPVYVCFFAEENKNIFVRCLKASCGIILFLNVMAGIIYLKDLFALDSKQQFVNVRGVTGNKDINDLASKLKVDHVSTVSLFLTNGLETAWLADSLRSIKLDKVVHNTQPLMEKEFDPNHCGKIDDATWHPSKYMIILNPNLARSDITDPPVGGKLIYSNRSFNVIDSGQLQTLIYLGAGAYPVEYTSNQNKTFASKFRWVEKGMEILIYSNKNKLVNFKIEVIPGFVNTSQPERHFVIKTRTGNHGFSIKAKTMLTLPSVKLHQGLNCLAIENIDKVTRFPRRGSLIRSNIPLDPRLNNFAISYVGMKD